MPIVMQAGRRFGVIVLCAPLTLAASSSATTQIGIDNFTFGPGVVTVAAGSRVTWTNRDDIPHTVTSANDPRILRSGALDTGDSVSFVFGHAGTFRYFCSLHPRMHGEVVVK